MIGRIEKIYSKINPEVLLHTFYLCTADNTVSKQRIDITDEDECIQIAHIKLEKEQTFKPHKHIPLIRETDITQETWIVIQGNIEVTYYDLDDTIICKHVLGPGDCTMTFHGGHNYKCLTQDTLVYEVKNGPYYGQTKDKVHIEND